MGSANIIGPIFQCYGSTASLSRTSIIDNIGANTVLHAAYAFGVMILVLVALTSTLFYLPKATLASIVMFGVFGMYVCCTPAMLLSVIIVIFCFFNIFNYVGSHNTPLIFLHVGLTFQNYAHFIL